MEHTAYLLVLSLITICSSDISGSSDSQEKTKNETIKRISELEGFLVPLPADQIDSVINATVVRYLPVNSPSQLCRDHSLLVLESFRRKQLWALKMLDAGTKLMSGVLDGHLQDLGNFEQCVNIVQPDDLFQAQHCVVQTAGFLNKNIQMNENYPTDITFSICVPSSCSVEDVASHVDSVLAGVNATTMYSFAKSSDVDESSLVKFLTCSEKKNEQGLRMEDFVALTVFLTIGCLLFTITMFEKQVGPKSIFSGLSLRTSLQSLMDTKVPDNEISCLNGLRVIFIIFVVAYSRLYGMMYLMPSLQRKSIVEAFSSITLRLLEASTVSVNVFLLIGGTVATYTFFVKREKQKEIPLWKSNLIRYFRLTPALAVMMLFYATLSIHTSQGPIWAQSAERIETPCRSYWWTGLLHISNYHNADSVCVAQSWYVACDFQLYVLSSLVLMPLYKSPKLWPLYLIPNIVVPMIAMAVKSYIGDFYPGSLFNLYELQRDTNDSSAVDFQGFHIKLCYYCIGIALGYVLFLIKHNKVEISLSKPMFTLGWTLAGSLLTAYVTLSLLILHPDHKYKPWYDPVFNGVAKPLACMAIAWLIFACSLGHGGIINRFLSCSAFRPLARLVYGVCLIHVLVILTHCYSVQVPQAFSYKEFMFILCGDITVSFTLAAVLYLAVEAPCLRLVKNLLADKSTNEAGNLTKQQIASPLPPLKQMEFTKM